MLFQAPSSPYLVPFDGKLRLAECPTTSPDDAPGRKKLKKRLEKASRQLSELQKVLYAHDRFAVLLVFQALDAAGKDSTIRAVLSGVNPAGCQVYSFKRPSSEELDHDFLWRSTVRLPERGRIGVFNRSYYEEVLVVKVHEDLLDHQKLPPRSRERLWNERYDSIRGLEQHLARNGTVILKFFLNVSKEEQRKRFLARLDQPDKNWKFELGDVRERGHFDEYRDAYERAMNATSRSWAPWYAIPADDKPFMRVVVAELIAESLKSLPLEFPSLSPDETARLGEMRSALEAEAPAPDATAACEGAEPPKRSAAADERDGS
jgi:PPK2 family polyphosphate:nucleotide phosphotransferase